MISSKPNPIENSLQKNVDLSSKNTFRIGGKAEHFIVVESHNELINAIEWANQKNLPFFLIGSGSNILIDNKGFAGLIIKLSGEFCNIEINDQTIKAGGGTPLPLIGNKVAQLGFCGFEFMSVIPGTIGAAVKINAGTTNDGEIKDVLIDATIYSADKENKIITLTNKELGFSYRNSILNNKSIVLSATFKLPDFSQKVNPDKIVSRTSKIKGIRKKHQPKNPKNCGSVFKTPQSGKYGAGWYIEKVGLKGHKEGGAQIAAEHANWIVNNGDASSNDVKTLISLIQSKVYTKFNILLERELIYVPDDII